MCVKSTNSILRSKNFNEFKLSCVITEMESHAPITLSLLRSCLTGRKPSKASNQRCERVEPSHGLLSQTELLGFVVQFYLEGGVSR